MTTLICGAQTPLGLAFVRALVAHSSAVIAAVQSPAKVPPALHDLRDDAPTLVQVAPWSPDDAPALTGVTQVIVAELPIPPAPADESDPPLADLGALDLPLSLRETHALLAPTVNALRWAGTLAPARLLVQASWLGSVQARVRGGNYAQGLAYAAHLMLVRTAALDLQRAGIGVVIANAGRYRLDMAGPGFHADVDDVARGLLGVIGRADPDAEPAFLDWRGAVQPW